MDIKLISNELKRLEQNAEFSSKGHFNSAAIFSRRHMVIGLLSIVFSSFAGASFIMDLPIDPRLSSGVTEFASILASIFIAVATFMKPSERAESHRQVGNKYLSLKGEARRVRTIGMDVHSSSHEILLDLLESLTGKMDELNDMSPEILNKAYKQAKKGIEKGEAEFDVDTKE